MLLCCSCSLPPPTCRHPSATEWEVELMEWDSEQYEGCRKQRSAVMMKAARQTLNEKDKAKVCKQGKWSGTAGEESRKEVCLVVADVRHFHLSVHTTAEVLVSRALFQSHFLTWNSNWLIVHMVEMIHIPLSSRYNIFCLLSVPSKTIYCVVRLLHTNVVCCFIIIACSKWSWPMWFWCLLL